MIYDKIKPKAVTIIGMGQEGCLGLSAKAVNRVAEAQVLIGTERFLSFFPQFKGQTIVMKGPLNAILDQIYRLSAENNVVVLASGDPMFYGIGDLIVRKMGRDFVEVIPYPGTMQTAFSRIGMKWDDAEIISLHGRPLAGLITKLQRQAKVGLFTDHCSTPQAIARYMLSYQETGWEAYVCESLGSTQERVRKFSIEALASAEDIGPLNVLILIRPKASFRAPSLIGFFPEDEMAKRMPSKGLITKREVRLLTLGFFNLRRDSIVWDIGAGSGSVSIEAARLAYEGMVYAIEFNRECLRACRQNAIRHKVDNMRIIEGEAPGVLKGLPEPDTVFIGGSAGKIREIIDVGLNSLVAGGRLVINAITFETIQEVYRHFKRLGVTPEIIQLHVSRGVSVSRYLRYEATTPVHIFCLTKQG